MIEPKTKTMRALAAITTATTYEEVEVATGMHRMALAAFVHALERRGFIVKTRACRTKPAVFAITEGGLAHLTAIQSNGRIRRIRKTPSAVVASGIATMHPLHSIWAPSVEAAERLGFEPFSYAERS